ncbi:hypothetical protein [Candidatus Poriferisocius sp.]|uniref:hypothetical protein n=1 Tax=Candidatus Poriferisocius sp. TaxID=3101276 RepID=UPI003B027DFF
MRKISKVGATVIALLIICGAIAVLSVASAHDTDNEVASRDALVKAQEDLLNTYRCLFSIDMQLVPGGCDPDRELGLVPEVGVSGTGAEVRTASLGTGRYQVDISVQHDDDFYYFGVQAHDSGGRCELLANETVDDSWSASVVLNVSTERFSSDCNPGDLLIEVDAPSQSAWQIAFTSR